MSNVPGITVGNQQLLELLLAGTTRRFPDDLEAAYRAQYNVAAADSTRSAAIIVLVVIAIFAGLDPFALPRTYQEAWSLRPAMQAGPALMLALFSRRAFVVRYIQALMVVSLMTGALCTMLILSHAQPAEWGYFLYPYALAQIAALVYTGSRLRFPYALAAGGFLFFGYVLTALLGQRILTQPGGAVAFVLPLFFLLAINVIGAISCLNTERLLRRNFLQQCLIRHEHARAEHLLHDMLPGAIIERLKRHESVADTIDEASVLFADLTRFTALAARMPAGSVLALLEALFARFDALALKHGVEKIKTIGDAYMAASGVPVPRPDHAQALARMALDMREAVTALRVIEPELDVRIGIATGPLVAGVIGSSRRAYDLWGDTVNLASRLESQGLPGQIQVDARTCECLCEEFDVVPRGTVLLKGRGECATYWLKSARNGGAG